MDFTINCTSVPVPEGTLFEGEPIVIGPAPVQPGLKSDHVSPRENNDGATLNPREGWLPMERIRDPNSFSNAGNIPFLALLTPALFNRRGAWRN